MGENPPHLLMPIYEYVCEPCRWRVEELRSVDDRDDPIGCETCHEPMERRMMSGMTILNRQKRGGFRFDPCKMNPWDDRLHHMRTLENSRDSNAKQKLREFSKSVGPKIIGGIVGHKKANYG